MDTRQNANEILDQFTIEGRDTAGNLVAIEHCDSARHASKVAAGWRESGLTVEVLEPSPVLG